MGEGKDQRTAGGLARRFALDTGLLFAAMAAPFLVLDIGTAILAAFGIFGVCVLWLVVAQYLRNRGKPKQPARIRLLLRVYKLSIPIAASGLTVLFFIEWMMWAYRPITSAAETWHGLVIALIVVAATLIFPPILFLLLAPRPARKDGGAASRFLNGVRARGFGWFQYGWMIGITGTAAPLSLVSIILAPTLREFEAWRDSDGIVTIWELVAAYPFLPLALLVAAAILSLDKFLREPEDDSIAQAYIDGAADEPLPNAISKPVLGALAAGACVVALFFIIYPVHLQMTAKGFRDGRTALYGIVEALEILRNTHEDDDWTNAEYAAALNRFGYWRADEPEAGLGSLVADPGQIFPDTCTVRVAAGTIDPPARGTDSPSAANEAEPELKFCVAIACAPPVTWSAPSALLLVTSHDSQAEGWRETWFADVQAIGVAPAPGGYCTATGELTEEFQG